jgi:hypothetical protein
MKGQEAGETMRSFITLSCQSGCSGQDLQQKWERRGTWILVEKP